MAKLSEYLAAPGVEDLPKRCRQAFAAALLWESQGKTDKAEDWLSKAIAYEKEGK